MDCFAKNLKELRLEYGLSQAELAEKLGVDFRTISNWENGVRKPDIDMLVIVADFFEVSTDFLLGKDD